MSMSVDRKLTYVRAERSFNSYSTKRNTLDREDRKAHWTKTVLLLMEGKQWQTVKVLSLLVY